MSISASYDKFSKKVTKITGSYGGFILACLLIFTGDKSINLIGFLMLFFIQQSQNKDTRAIQMKLDELIRATGEANNDIRRIEEKTDEEIEQLERGMQ